MLADAYALAICGLCEISLIGSPFHTLARLDRWFDGERMVRYPCALFVATVGVYMFGLLGSPGPIHSSGRVLGEDYLAFFMAGDLAVRGQIGDLYDVAAQTRYQEAFVERRGGAWSGVCLYLNPPHYAGLLSLIAPPGYVTSLLIWWIASLAAFVGTLAIWRRWLPQGALPRVALLAVCMPAWFSALAGGQNSFFSLLILSGFCQLLMTGRPLLAGLALSLLGYKFQLLIVPAMFLLVTRRWRSLFGLAIGGAATLAGTAAWMGVDVVADYVRFASQLGSLMQTHGFDVHKQHSWYGALQLLFGGLLPVQSIRLLAATASLATIAPLAMIWRRDVKASENDGRLMLATCMMATLLASPHLFHYDLLIVCLPVVLAIGAQPVRGDVDRRKLLLAGGFVWLAIGPMVAPILHLQITPWLMVMWMVDAVRGLSLAQIKAAGRLDHRPHRMPTVGAR